MKGGCMLSNIIELMKKGEVTWYLSTKIKNTSY